MKHDVFISYSSKNSEIADEICRLLEDNGIGCWIAPRDIPTGQKYASVISAAIKSCKITLLLFSEHAALSPWVESEIAMAFDNKKLIIPFKIDDVELEKYPEFDIRLSNKHWVDASQDPASEYQQLLTVISTDLGVDLAPKMSEPMCPCGSGKPFSRCHGKTKWEVGDYYNVNGVEGVVFWTDPTGTHGKIVSLKQAYQMNWSPMVFVMQNKNSITGATDENDGYLNQKAIMKLDNWEELYPAFYWCSCLGEGWYLPAKRELQELLQGSACELVNKTLTAFNAPLSIANEYSFSMYWSSTEVDRERAYVVSSLYMGSFHKYSYDYVRAIRCF